MEVSKRHSVLVLLTIQFNFSFGANLFCFFPSWGRYRIDDLQFSVKDINAQHVQHLCTHLSYAYATLDEETFNIKGLDPSADIDNHGYADFVALKNSNKALKTFVAITLTGHYSTNGKYSKLFGNTTNIGAFATLATAFLREHGFDGLDFHWTYPDSPEDRNNFFVLMAALKAKLHGYLLCVTINVHRHQPDKEFDVASLNQSTDFLNVVTYNFHTLRDSHADHPAPLKKRPFETASSETKNVDYHINYFIQKGFSASKINLGIALFGKTWVLASPNNHTPPALATGGGPAGRGTNENGTLGYYEICNNTKKNGWKVFNDSNGYTGPYAVSPGNPAVWVGYDDPEMAARKAEYARLRGLGGVMVWDISLDDNRNICGGGVNPMMTAIKKALSEDLSSNKAIAGIIISSLIVLFGLGAIVSFVIRSACMKKRLRYVTSLAKLLEGNLNEINPDLSLDGQAELLPYDAKWEFPIERLFLEQVIGFGHYGRVVKARAVGIQTSRAVEMEVAVKMVRSSADVDELKALASELKILVHLGCHLNVVNLIGAVTKNIAKGNLMVILEYCRHGNVKDFLVKNRGCFINDLINDHAYLKPCSSLKAAAYTEQVNCVTSTKGCRTARAESPSSLQPVKTSELIEWAYQIASGMNYLANKKVIHGDLAARNVLLADDNVVKIADFGLSRKTYMDSNYQKKGTEAMPVKWMAIEALRDRVFSSKSDVWSFGVTLWEVFSLGQEPYPGVRTVEMLDYLDSGNRLKISDCVPNVINGLMANCWKCDPDERPTFELCEKILASLLSPDALEQFTKLYDKYNYIIPNNASTKLPDQASQDNNEEECEDYLEVAIL